MSQIRELHTSDHVLAAGAGLFAWAVVSVATWGRLPEVALVLAALIGMLVWRASWRITSLTADAVVTRTAFASNSFANRRIKFVSVSRGHGRVYDFIWGYSLVLGLDPSSGSVGWFIPIGFFERTKGECWASHLSQALELEARTDRPLRRAS